VKKDCQYAAVFTWKEYGLQHQPFLKQVASIKLVDKFPA
jgi:hypothetical protein